MKKARPQMNAPIYITDGGLETELIFKEGIDLPHFAAFPLIQDPDLSNTLTSYYQDYMELAANHGLGYILETPTWRANRDWAYKLGFTENELKSINKKSVDQMKTLREGYGDLISEIIISGQIGPRGDGYATDSAMTKEAAASYHDLQIQAFKEAGADMISAITMTYVEEALGIVEQAKKSNMPVVISFTVETDGNLPSGETLEKAITLIDNQTDSYATYYMINCAHPSHFMDALDSNRNWKTRIQGVRANASCKSHEELDNSTELDSGNRHHLGSLHRELRTRLPNLKVYGGCCGTDVSHVKSICDHVL